MSLTATAPASRPEPGAATGPVVPLVRAVQEQQAQIKELKAQVAAPAGDHAELQAVKAQAAATEAFGARLRLEASSAQAQR